MWAELVAACLLLLLNGFLAAIRVAVARVRRSQIKELAAVNPRARIVLRWLEDREGFLSTMQLWITVTGIAVAVVAGVVLISPTRQVFAGWGVGTGWQYPFAVVALVVVLSMIFTVICGLVPRKIATTRAQSIALGTARVANPLARIGWLPAKILGGVASLLAAPFRHHNGNGYDDAEEEEFEIVYHEGMRRDDLDEAERDLIENVIEFSDTTIRQAMTPRTDIVGIDVKLNQDAILRKISEEGYSRFPVYEGDLDHIKGVIHTRDVINVMVHSNLIILDDLIRPVMFVPDSKLISSLMKEFQTRQQHLAVVLDEFGGTAGLITMEDILEEIVGEIRDEHDVEVDPFILLEDNLCRVEASFPIEDFQKKFQVKLTNDNSADTVAGYLVNRTGKLPQKGEKIIIEGLEFNVTQVEGPRIEMLRVRKLPKPPDQN